VADVLMSIFVIYQDPILFLSCSLESIVPNFAELRFIKGAAAQLISMSETFS
jgi:hypothetical protein